MPPPEIPHNPPTSPPGPRGFLSDVDAPARADLPPTTGTIAIEIRPHPYTLPSAAGGDQEWLVAHCLIAEAALEQGDLTGAQEALGALGIIPATLRGFQETFPQIWHERVGPLLLKIAEAIHRHPPPGESNRLPFYAASAKDFLRRWIVIEEGGRLSTYRREPLERGPHPEATVTADGRPALCNPHYQRYRGNGHYEEVINAQIWMGELVGQLRRAVAEPEALPCYIVLHPQEAVLAITASDATVGEQTTVPLHADVTASGYAVTDLRWDLRFGPPGATLQRGPTGLWTMTTPRVVADGVPIGLTATVTNELGWERSVAVALTVQNTINEQPTVTIRGPRQVEAGTTVRLQATGNDPNPADRGKLQFTWRQLPGSAPVEFQGDPTGRSVTFLAPPPPPKKNPHCTFEVTVRDPHGGTATARKRVAITPRPAPPLPPPEQPVRHDLAKLEHHLRQHDPAALPKLQVLATMGPVSWAAPDLGQAAGLVPRLRQILHEEQPLERMEVCLVADLSGSMENNVHDLARGLGQIAAEFTTSSRSSNLCLVTLTDEDIRLRWGIDPTRSVGEDIAEVKKILQGVTFKGGLEYLAEAGQVALQEMVAHGVKGAPKRRIVVITDEHGDLKVGGETLRSIAAKARSEGIGFETIFLTDAEDRTYYDDRTLYIEGTTF